MHFVYEVVAEHDGHGRRADEENEVCPSVARHFATPVKQITHHDIE